MRTTIFLLFVVLSLGARTQVLCDGLPISYDPGSAAFTEGEFSFGDSVIIVNITNTSAVDMAYPQLKLVPVTPLPPGMVMNTHWATFASSWNTGQTMPASIFFDVAMPIPANHTVTFEVWANNLTPLLADDSCRFKTDLTIDLAPTGMGLDEHHSERGLDVWPMPASGELQVDFPAGSGGELVLRTTSGSVLQVMRVQPLGGRQVMDLAGLADGTYILSLVTDAGVEERSKVVVLH